MIFQHTWEMIPSGKKTQTRRLAIAGKHAPSFSDGQYHAVYGVMGNPPLYEVGHTYAVQPGRGKFTIWYRWRSHHYQYWHTHHNGVPLAALKHLDQLLDEDERTGWQELRIRITCIRPENVRKISYEDARAEGFDSRIAFLEKWAGMHDKKLGFYCSEPATMFFGGHYRYWSGRKDGWQTTDLEGMLAILDSRPAERYQAWALTFELVKA